MWLFDVLRPAPRAANVPEAAIADIYRIGGCSFLLLCILATPLLRCSQEYHGCPATLDGELGLTKLQMGIILSLFDATYAFSKIVNGPLCDRTNPRYFMAIGLLGTALANFCLDFLRSRCCLVSGGFSMVFPVDGSPVGPSHCELVQHPGTWPLLRGLEYVSQSRRCPVCGCQWYGCSILRLAIRFFVPHDRVSWRGLCCVAHAGPPRKCWAASIQE